MTALTQIPAAAVPLCQHIVDTYASETNKTASTWTAFDDSELLWRPHEKSMTVGEVMMHHLLSERRFFGDFLGLPEPGADEVRATGGSVSRFAERAVAYAEPRLLYLANQAEEWWLKRVPFFDVERERVWIVWRRILHSAHHRTQLTVYLRLMNKPVVSIYGPTADVTWTGASPTVPV
ncbi:MAG TPA: DinB family protein [Bryobacteraceae bacterium]|nr:DinB family protein [Bryobacteraceae bacterium]